MLDEFTYEQIDELILRAEDVCDAVDNYSSELMRAYRRFNRSVEVDGYDEKYSAEREQELPSTIKSYMASIIQNLNELKSFNLESPCILTKRLEDMIREYLGSIEMMFDSHSDAESWHDVNDYIEWGDEFRAINLLTQFANIDSNIVLIGSNGSGKSTLAQILKGNDSERITVIPAQKSMFFINENETLSTRVGDVKDYMMNNNIENSKSESDYNFTDFQKHQFTRLVIAMREEYFTYLRNCAYNDHLPNHNNSIYGKVRRIIKTVFKDIDIEFGSSSDELIYCLRDNNAFPLNRLSEGEKAALYYSMSVLMASENSFIVIDEPETFLNPSLANKVWDVLVRERSDCQFIFITHSVNFTLARQDAKIIWIKKFIYPDQFEFEEVNDKYSLPKQLMTEILGSKTPVLFCEGDDKTSLDYKVYNGLLHENYTVIPVGGHKKVESYCKFMNEAEWIGIEARGVVDGDFRADDEIAALQSRKITVLPFNEIEMFLLDDDVLEATIKGSNPAEYENLIEEFKNAFWLYYSQNKGRIAIKKLKVNIDGYLESKKIDKSSDVSDIKNNLQTILKINVDRMHDEIIEELNQIFSSKDYGRLLKNCNLKKEISRGIANRTFGNDYEKRAIEHIATDKELQRKIIEKYFCEFTISD